MTGGHVGRDALIGGVVGHEGHHGHTGRDAAVGGGLGAIGNHEHHTHGHQHGAGHGTGPVGGTGVGAGHVGIGQKISGKVEAAEGKLTNNPGKVIEGHLKQGKDVTIQNSANVY